MGKKNPYNIPITPLTFIKTLIQIPITSRSINTLTLITIHKPICLIL